MVNQLLVSLGVSALLLGCVTTTPYDYSVIEQEKPASILVIPPMNNSIEVNAPYTYLSVISRPLAEKGYYVFPVSVVDAFLKENGLPTPAEMNAIPLDKIQQYIGADAILYVTIEDWGQKYVLLSSNTVVQAHVRLVSVKTGALLWESTVQAQQSSGDGGGGLVGALVSAAVTQVMGSLDDQTPLVARQANTVAFNVQGRGLPNGPYKIVAPK